jgi:DNA mismatch repair protein MutL
MLMPIRVLDPTVASQIAAGEVVERPASVIKELLENALDAGARRINVEVRGGGITELRIQDDGSGIAPDEVELAFQRHATSKLQTAEDLFAISTLGFRGEALPSIASIAQVTCTTRIAGEATGVELRIAGGELQSRSMVGGQVGTTFIIRNLFYNIPVRREFLRSAAIESAAIGTILTQYALAYPHIRFSLSVDGKLRMQTNGSGLLSDVMLSVYGLEVARAMLPIDFSDGGELTGITLRGLVSPPTISRGSRDAIHISVNGRAISARGQVASILDEAYHTFLMKGRFPYVVLAIAVHPAAVDVNVHPTKSEVKFRDPDRVRAILARAIRSIVQANIVVQGWDGGSVIAPFARDSAQAEDTEQLAFEAENAVPEVGNSGEARSIAPVPEPQTSDQWAGIREKMGEYRAPADPIQVDRPTRPEDATERVPANHPANSITPADPVPANRHVPAEAGIVTSDSIPSEPRLPRLRALAQLARMYLLAEGSDGDLYLIDQHAAHERITFERLMEQRGRGAIESQRMLIPQIVVLPPATQAALLGAKHDLAEWGFEIEETEQGVRIRAVPASVAADEIKAALLEVADHLSGTGGSTPDRWREEMLVTLSCHTSVRAGQPLTSAEQQALIDQLARCQGPRTCPHGRPTLIILTKQQLVRQFGRIQ